MAVTPLKEVTSPMNGTTSDGNIVSTNGDQATVDAEGTYTLSVIFDDGTSYCIVQASMDVIEDPDVPFAFAQDALLTCDPPSIELDGSGSTEGNSFDFLWTTDDGIILNGETSLFPLISAGGTYILEVTNVFSGCTDEYDIFVTADQEPPIAFAFTNETLDCSGSSIVIDGTQSTFDDHITYEWTTSDGNIVDGADEQSPTIDQAGTYNLLVTNELNGCTDETNIDIDGVDNNVMATIFTPDPITCTTESVFLDGSLSTPSVDVTYNWSTIDGLIIDEDDIPQINAGMVGTYQLIVTEETTGCADTTSIMVNGDFTPPAVEAGDPASFQCGDSSISLDGTGSSANNATYLWTTFDGQILSDPSNLNPSISSAGTYYLMVTDTQNGCTALDSVVISSDSNSPVVQIIANDILDCDTDSLLLDASSSSNGSNYSFTWTTSDGNITSGSQTLMPYVDAPGTYQLSITDTQQWLF